MDQVINNIQYISSSMGKVCVKHIIVLWKMVKNMFLLDSEHVRMMKCTSPHKKSCLFMVDAWFQKIILQGYDFFVAAVIRYAAKVYL